MLARNRTGDLRALAREIERAVETPAGRVDHHVRLGEGDDVARSRDLAFERRPERLARSGGIRSGPLRKSHERRRRCHHVALELGRGGKRSIARNAGRERARVHPRHKRGRLDARQRRVVAERDVERDGFASGRELALRRDGARDCIERLHRGDGACGCLRSRQRALVGDRPGIDRDRRRQREVGGRCGGRGRRGGLRSFRGRGCRRGRRARGGKHPVAVARRVFLEREGRLDEGQRLHADAAFDQRQQFDRRRDDLSREQVADGHPLGVGDGHVMQLDIEPRLFELQRHAEPQVADRDLASDGGSDGRGKLVFEKASGRECNQQCGRHDGADEHGPENSPGHWALHAQLRPQSALCPPNRARARTSVQEIAALPPGSVVPSEYSLRRRHSTGSSRRSARAWQVGDASQGWT